MSLDPCWNQQRRVSTLEYDLHKTIRLMQASLTARLGLNNVNSVVADSSGDGKDALFEYSSKNKVSSS